MTHLKLAIKAVLHSQRAPLVKAPDVLALGLQPDAAPAQVGNIVFFQSESFKRNHQTETNTHVHLNALPLSNGPLNASKRSKQSAWLFASVLLHLGVFAVFLNQQMQASEKPKIPPPMLVSLVENPVPAPAIEEVQPEVIPTPPKPVVNPKKPVVKKPEIIKNASPQPVVEETVAAPVQAAPVVAEAPPAPPEKAEPIAEAPPPPAVIEPPKFGAAYLHNPAPNYPPLSRRLNEEGRVLLRVLVATNGSAEQVKIENTSGSGRLDQAAVDAVKNWAFIPAKRDNQAISAYVLVPVKFSLSD